ncbi:MAG: pilus assembly protein PilM [Lachnospiraceae bacterium]|nr:pilus assembly protein PilM [Lachnospiraceae bacterium]
MALNRVVNIEIGLFYTKVCETNFKKKNTKVYRTFIFDTPENTIEDGYIRDKQSFADELKYQLQTNGFKNKNIVFTVASNKILSREVVIPAVKESKIMDIVKAEANEYFPMDITDHILTYTLLGELPETKQLRIMVFAAPATLVKNYYSVAELMGVSIVALDYIGNSNYQVLKRLEGEENHFVVQMNQQNTMVSILQKEALLLQRSVNFGVANLVDLMRSYNTFSNLSLQECYSRLCEEELLTASADSAQSKDADKAEELDEMKDEMMDELEMFVNNLLRVMEYFNGREQGQQREQEQNAESEQTEEQAAEQSTEPKSGIHKVYFLGEGTEILGLRDLLETELGLPVEIIETLQGITFKQPEEEQTELENELFSCIGAALKPVNFIPEELLNKNKQNSSNRMLLLLLLLVVVAAGTLVFTGYMDYQEAEWENERLKNEVESYIYIEEKYNAFVASGNERDEAVLMLANTFSYLEYVNELIAELEEELPTNSIVQSLSASNESVFISFVTKDKETAAKLLAQLKEIPYVGTTTISGITENSDEEGGESTVTFSVSLTWTLPEEVSAQ